MTERQARVLAFSLLAWPGWIAIDLLARRHVFAGSGLAVGVQLGTAIGLWGGVAVVLGYHRLYRRFLR